MQMWYRTLKARNRVNPEEGEGAERSSMKRGPSNSGASREAVATYLHVPWEQINHSFAPTAAEEAQHAHHLIM